MKPGRLIVFVGAAIVASSSAPLAGVSVASAAAAPTVSGFNIPFDVGHGCEGLATISEDRDPNGAYVIASLDSDPCHVGVEGIIEGPTGPFSNGGDIKNAGGNVSVTGDIPINSSNCHGIRWWTGSQWQYNWYESDCVV